MLFTLITPSSLTSVPLSIHLPRLLPQLLLLAVFRLHLPLPSLTSRRYCDTVELHLWSWSAANAYPLSAALSLRNQAKATLHPNTQVPLNTLRISLSSNDHGNLARQQIQRILHTNQASNSGLPLFQGEVVAYLAFAELDKYELGDQLRAGLASYLPNSIAFADHTRTRVAVPLRHSYEREWCHKCKFCWSRRRRVPRFPTAPRAPFLVHPAAPAAQPVASLKDSAPAAVDADAFQTPRKTGSARAAVSSANAIPITANKFKMPAQTEKEKGGE
ncbi:hypothetical protein BCR35DRAFT_336208 [Leucosporidium creatinivorum]|uniref:Uncharacterized protein n=1 Tax=Leucosporidium creatinivorum TaxID=106004 RepID=A0A1Y2CI21_9BASI|nr:hypothetical protein BCR35DRAFT_336208 [Leucosporidium creatinivorum]